MTETDAELRERVAVAVFHADGFGAHNKSWAGLPCASWDEVGETVREVYRRLADAAIAELQALLRESAPPEPSVPSILKETNHE